MWLYVEQEEQRANIIFQSTAFTSISSKMNIKINLKKEEINEEKEQKLMK